MSEVESRPDLRLPALRRFAAAITILTILGHTLLGFEQSVAQPLIALATAYGVEIFLELLNAWSQRRPPRFLGGTHRLINFLLPAHISGLAVAMLIYPNDRLWPVAFATSVAIGSKMIFRAPVGKGDRHFYNPSNLGITVTLLLFSWVGVAPPYQFTHHVDRLGDWLLPAIIVASGSFLNSKFTHRMPLILAWLGGFVGQAVLRGLLFDTPIVAGLLPMTGTVFILYTFYMVTDPATTPNKTLAQIVFGIGVALTYGLLVIFHVVFGLFFALTIVCTLRGIGLFLHSLIVSRSRALTIEPGVVAEKA